MKETEKVTDTRMFENVVVVGGNTLANGFIGKMKELADGPLQDIKDITYKLFEFPIGENRLISNWIGGSIVMNVPNFRNFAITKEEYDEQGFSIIERKCP